MSADQPVDLSFSLKVELVSFRCGECGLYYAVEPKVRHRSGCPTCLRVVNAKLDKAVSRLQRRTKKLQVRKP